VAAIALALASALAWGTGDFLGGLTARKQLLIVVLAGSQLAGLALAVILALVVADPLPDGAHVWPAVVAGLGGAAGLACYYRALAVGTMSVVAPVASMAAVVPLLVGLVRGDRPGALAVVGIVLAFVGVVLASRPAEDEATDGPDGPTRGWIGPGVVLALLSALGLGTFMTAIDTASEAGVPWALVIARSTSSLLCLVALAAARPARGWAGSGSAAALPIGAVGLFDVGANALYAVATTKGYLSGVSVVGSMYPVATVVLAAILLRERLARGQSAGVVLALAGVALIALG
jgi:drug/metabolite transporter (DMT)-like permease